MRLLRAITAILSQIGSGSVEYAANSANLNGTTQGFTAVDHVDWDLGSGDWFISARVKRVGTVLHLLNQVNGGNYLQVIINSTNVQVWDNTRGGLLVDFAFTDIPSGTNHLLLQRKADVLEFYVNGSLDSSGALTGTLGAPSAVLEIGKSVNDSSFNDIELGMYEFGKGNSLSTGEITSLYNEDRALCYADIPSGIQTKITMSLPLANWTGFTGQELLDQTANGHDATNVGSTPFTGTGLIVECSSVPHILFAHTWNGNAAIQNNKAELDGTGDYIEVTDNATDIEDVLVGSNDFTIETNIETDVNKTQCFMVMGNGALGWSTGTTDGLLFLISEYLGDIYFQWETGNNVAFVSAPGSLVGGKSVIVVRESGRISLYLDGTRLDTTTTTTTIVKYASVGSTTYLLGAISPSDQYVDGRYDDIRISNTARYDATQATITPESLINDTDVVYLNTFTGANGSTPTNNTKD